MGDAVHVTGSVRDRRQGNWPKSTRKTLLSSHTIGILKLDIALSYPNIDCELDPVVPHRVPPWGGKSLRIEKFSLSLTNPTVSIKVDPEDVFSSSVTVSLDTRNCQISVSDRITADIVAKKYRGSIGPASVSYMTPLRLVEPEWSTHPVVLDAEALQACVLAMPANQAIHCNSREVHNDTATQDALRALLTFCGAGGFIDDMLQNAKVLGRSLASAQPATGVPRTWTRHGAAHWAPRPRVALSGQTGPDGRTSRGGQKPGGCADVPIKGYAAAPRWAVRYRDPRYRVCAGAAAGADRADSRPRAGGAA